MITNFFKLNKREPEVSADLSVEVALVALPTQADLLRAATLERQREERAAFLRREATKAPVSNTASLLFFAKRSTPVSAITEEANHADLQTLTGSVPSGDQVSCLFWSHKISYSVAKYLGAGTLANSGCWSPRHCVVSPTSNAPSLAKNNHSTCGLKPIGLRHGTTSSR